MPFWIFDFFVVPMLNIPSQVNLEKIDKCCLEKLLSLILREFIIFESSLFKKSQLVNLLLEQHNRLRRVQFFGKSSLVN